jgi:hypothetical protein
MFKRLQHITVLLILLFSFTEAVAQIAMPDTVCVGVSRVYRVNAASPLSTYTWTVEGVTQTSTANEMNATWNTAGVFLVTVQEHSANGCDGELRSGLVYVEPKAKANAGRDTIVCFGKMVQLNGSGGNSYEWSPSTFLSDVNAANPVATIPAAGEYSYVLNVTNNNSCPSSASDTVLITVLPLAKVFAGNDTTVGLNQPLQLHAADVNNTGFTEYTWSPALGLNDWLVQNPVATVGNDVTFSVTASTAGGCVANDAVTVRISRVAEIYVPSAFAPGGINNLLHAIPVGIREFRYFAVYNRYGELVFKTSNPAEGWDGKYKGVAQSSAGFVWMAEGVSFSGKVIARKGNVVLVR